jgi:hypothetical protein
MPAGACSEMRSELPKTGVVLEADDFLKEGPDAEHLSEDVADVFVWFANALILVLSEHFYNSATSSLKLRTTLDLNTVSFQRLFKIDDESLQILQRGDLASLPQFLD